MSHPASPPPDPETSALAEPLDEVLRRALVFDVISDGVIITDLEGTIVDCNRSAERIMGHAREELVGRPLAPTQDPARSGALEREIRARVLSDGRWTGDIPVCRRDGEMRVVDSSVGLLLDGGRPVGIVGVHRDVTDGRRAENDLRASEAEQRALIGAMSDVIFVLDRDGRYLKIAPSAASRLFRPPAELLGRRLHDVFDQPRADFFLGFVHRALSTWRAVDFEYALEIGGEEIWFAATVSPMLEDRVLWVARDITARVSAERALRLGEERYRRMFEDSPAANYVSTGDGRMLACNTRFARMFGFDTPDEIINAGAFALYDQPARRQGFLERLRASGGRVEGTEVELRRRDGSSLHALETATARFDERGEIVEIHGYILDVTERHRLEAQLRQAQKMEAVGRLAGGIAHDFNNLLTAILSNCELALTDLSPGGETHEEVLEIKRAADRAASLTRQLLAFSRRQLVRPEALDLNLVIADAERMLRRLIGEHITLVASLAHEPVVVRADRGQLEQVLINLVLNARDAMPDGGTVAITTRHHVQRWTTVRGDAATGELRPGAYVVLEVADTGHGMDDEVQRRVFEPFFTTKEVGRGTGLGLATVYGIVEQSGGVVLVESAPGKGSRFSIYLPALPQSAEESGEAPRHPAGRGGRETVLLVEDENAVRSIVKRLLTRQGYTVLEASNAEQALAICAERGVPPDLVLSDIVMPGRRGPELVADLRARYGALRAIYMSGYDKGGALRRGAIESGGRILEKPFTTDALLRMIREVLDAAP